MCMTLEIQINKLRDQGYSYNQIANELNCSKGTISYFLNPEVKLKKQCRQTTHRKNLKIKYQTILGGQCKICGYKKSNKALHFHHKDPSQKLFEITSANCLQCLVFIYSKSCIHVNFNLITSIMSDNSAFAMNNAPYIVFKLSAICNINSVTFFFTLYNNRYWLLKFKHYILVATEFFL